MIWYFNMKKSIFALIIALCLLLCACGSDKQQNTPETVSAISFTDDLGREIVIAEPGRVAALLGSFAQVWMLAGGDICATADDAWDDMNLELAKDTVNLGNTKELSLELLLASEPELVLASTNTRQNMEWLDTFDAAGIPAAYFDITDFSDYLRVLGIFTRITGRDDLYEKYGAEVRRQVDAVIEKSRARLADGPAPTVLTMRASAAGVTVKNSSDNVLGAMLADLGCINIADSDALLLDELSMERILEADPDIIFIIPRGDNIEGMHEFIENNIMTDPAWAQLTAVREGRIYYMDKTLFNLKPNHRWGEAYEILEEILSNE